MTRKTDKNPAKPCQIVPKMPLAFEPYHDLWRSLEIRDSHLEIREIRDSHRTPACGWPAPYTATARS